ncbi:MAG: feoB, partial [Verrucomicrobia bacterium]|nr:feoB [Verrucomicrobiota bacterium]
YNIEEDDSEEGTQKLAEILKSQTREDGTKLYTTLLGLTLMVFYVYALQCVSTVAIVYRETGGWKWAIFQLVYMGALAWGASFVVYQGGRLLGYQ